VHYLVIILISFVYSLYIFLTLTSLPRGRCEERMEEGDALPLIAGEMEFEGEVGALTVAAVDQRFIRAAVAVSVANNEFTEVCVEKWGDDPAKWGPNNIDTTNLRMLCRKAWLPKNYNDRPMLEWLAQKASEQNQNPFEVICTRKIAHFPQDVKQFRTAAFKAADRAFDLQLAEAKKHFESMRVVSFNICSFIFFLSVVTDYALFPRSC
jgi:hypothetical protein